MSSSQPQKSDSSGPSTDGHPQGPLGGADQGERPQTPVATLCANSPLPPQTSVALPSLPVFGTGMSLTSSSPVVPVPQSSAGGHFFLVALPAPQASPLAFPRPGSGVACTGRCMDHPLSAVLPQGLCSPHLPALPLLPVPLLVASRFPDRLLALVHSCSFLLPVRQLLEAPRQVSFWTFPRLFRPPDPPLAALFIGHFRTQVSLHRLSLRHTSVFLRSPVR